MHGETEGVEVGKRDQKKKRSAFAAFLERARGSRGERGRGFGFTPAWRLYRVSPSIQYYYHYDDERETTQNKTKERQVFFFLCGTETGKTSLGEREREKRRQGEEEEGGRGHSHM